MPRPLPLALLALLAGAPLAADTGTRLTELGAGADDGVDGLDAAVAGAALYFVGRDGAASRALYRYDGVNPPALVPDSTAPAPRGLIGWNGKVYFQGGAGDRELWVHDPAAGTVELALDVRAGGNGNPQRFALFDGRLCFGAYSTSDGFELFCWDGANPPELFDLAPDGDSSFVEELTAWGPRLAFVAQVGGERALWTYDGFNPPAAVAPAPGEPYDFPCCLAAGGDGALYFEASESGGTARLWRYDGLTAPTRVSTSFSPWGFPGAPRGRLLVDGEDSDQGVADPELWRLVDGDLERVRPATTLAATTSWAAAGGVVYSVGESVPTSGDLVLFRHCLGADLAPTDAFDAAAAAVVGERALAFAGRVFVSAEDAAHGEELWSVTPSHLFCADFEASDTADWQ